MSQLPALLKVPFVLSIAWGIHATMTPPKPPPPPEERLKPVGLEVAAPWFAQFAKNIFTIAGVCEALVLIAAHYPDHAVSAYLLRYLVCGDDFLASASDIYVSLPFMLGWASNIFGSLIRLRCYAMLDNFFTFELSIRKNHHLVTSGPYSVVRHPSYTGAIFAAAGTLLSHFSRGSWLVECSGLLPQSATVLSALCAGGITIMLFAMHIRMDKEDEMLKIGFGKDWEQWVAKVPCRVIPGLL
ncbi:hypothetical protein FISHEDRAFT_39723 [Fistulina hepatica ATCC 64428]|uniref:Protein-S-isoprenylcysteine O-methyltransferase n=1 Tax=Fistulina hepatica ATCC 64428 TaxID=1128425 RepID=A0A0D7AGD0_9AGAR|nr:hypothetical protein FISHEDRAFT_39723 [Fistulina hepatica ATCC 64428]